MKDKKLHAVVARRCGAKQIWKSKDTKHSSVGALLKLEMLKKCTVLWREHDTTLHPTLDYTTLHYTILHYTTLYTTPQHTTRHDRTRHDATLRWHYATLHDITFTLLYIAWHYITSRYTTATPTATITPTLQLHNHNYNYTYTTTTWQLQLQLHYATATTTLDYTTTLHYNYPTLHYMTLHYTALLPTTLQSISGFVLPFLRRTLFYSLLFLKLPPPPCAVLLVFCNGWNVCFVGERQKSDYLSIPVPLLQENSGPITRGT